MRTLLLTLTTCLLVLPAYAKYSGGSGTAHDPYQIATVADLIALGETPTDYDKHFVLSADIDLDPKLPGRRVFDKAVIGSGTDPDYPYLYSHFQGIPFTGVFDGNGHAISHLTMTGADFLGLFGVLDGEVKNLGVVDVNITGSGNCVGALVGNAGTVAQCYSTGVIRGHDFVGGLAGSGANLTQCYSTATVTGDRTVGGLVGWNVGGTVTQCYSTGAVSGTESIGGLVGSKAKTGSVTSSFWDMHPSGRTASAGGIGLTTAQMQDIQIYLDAGWDFAGEIKDGLHEIWQMPEGGGYPVLAIFNGYTPLQLKGLGTPGAPYLIADARELGTVYHHSRSARYRLTASIDLSGIHWGMAVIPRFAGSFDGNGHTISHLRITGGRYVGLFGQLEPGAEVKDLGVVDVNVASDYGVGPSGPVGGLVAYNGYGGIVTRCCSTGVVRGGGQITTGGVVGSNDGTVTQCYSTAVVTGDGGVGGLVGANPWGTVTQCYSTGAVSSAGGYVGGLVGGDWGPVTACFWDIQTSGQTTSAGGTGKTTAEMQTAKTFLDAGWDFVGETKNGTEDIWWILEGKDYPRLWWEAAKK